MQITSTRQLSRNYHDDFKKMKTKPRINISFQARTKFPFGQNVWVKIDGQFKSRRIYVKVVTRSRRDVFYTFKNSN